MSADVPPTPPPSEHPARRSFRLPVALAIGVAVIALVQMLLVARARRGGNPSALSEAPKVASTVEAQVATFRDQRRFVGTFEPWQSARIGPQMISAYVDTVLVRPGATVRRGQVVATLDCRNAASLSEATRNQARALERTQRQLAEEASRVGSLLDRGFASVEEVERRRAESESKQAQLLALRAQAAGSSLQVADCVLRAPFDGEVAARFVDPGAYVRPGIAIATVIDRRTVRIEADVPEDDFADVRPGTQVAIRALASQASLQATISRRSPAADPTTRTIHLEIDLANADRSLPVGTTAELRLSVGAPQPALRVPLSAATLRGNKATLATVEEGVAHTRTIKVLGEREGWLYLEPAIRPGTAVVTQGRNGLQEGDKVQATPEPQAPARAPAAPEGSLRANGERGQ